MISKTSLYIVKLVNAPFIQKVLGLIFSVLLSIIIEVQTTILGMWGLIFVNSYFGIKVAYRESDLNYFFIKKLFYVIKSKKLEETVSKGLSYLLIMVCVIVMNKYIINLESFNFLSRQASLLQITAGILAFVELWSIGENFAKFYHVNPILKIISIFANEKISINKKR